MVIRPIPQPLLQDQLRVAGMTVQAHVARGMHAVWGGNVAGEMVDWYRTQLSRGGPNVSSSSHGWASLMAEALSSPPGAGGVLFLPHMSAAACPVVDPHSLGAFAGLHARATRGDILRAIIEGLNYQCLDIVLAMESVLGDQPGRLVAVGGASCNHFWMQNKADVIGRPIDVPAVQQATPLGAAMVAGIGVGVYRDELDAFQHVYRPGKTYEPDARRAAQYAKWFEIYRQLYPAVKSINHRLAREFMT
jgi:xylulokinase